MTHAARAVAVAARTARGESAEIVGAKIGARIAARCALGNEHL